MILKGYLVVTFVSTEKNEVFVLYGRDLRHKGVKLTGINDFLTSETLVYC